MTERELRLWALASKRQTDTAEYDIARQTEEPFILKTLTLRWLAIVATCVLYPCARAETWPQYRGPNGAAESANTQLPTTWSDSENLNWKCALPGPGSSSPVIGNAHVFVTSYSGYGADPNMPSDITDLVRHLVAVDKTNGRRTWVTDFPALQQTIRRLFDRTMATRQIRRSSTTKRSMFSSANRAWPPSNSTARSPGEKASARARSILFGGRFPAWFSIKIW